MPPAGLAVEQGSEGDRVLGAVVLSFENDKDGTLSYWEVSKRFGLLATAHNYLYDQILEYPLKVRPCDSIPAQAGCWAPSSLAGRGAGADSR